MRTLSLLAAALALAACNSRDADNLSHDATTLAQHTAQATRSVTLEAKVWATLSQRKGVEVSGIHVDTKDGVVTLTGHVSSEEEKSTAGKTADEIQGVDKVINNLKVEPKG